LTFHLPLITLVTFSTPSSALGVQKTCRCGTSGHGLAGMVVLG